MKFQLTNPRCFNTSSFSFPLSFRASSSRRSNSAASAMASRASVPVTAIIRRMPLAIPDSSVITNSLISPVFATCLKGAILSASKGIRRTENDSRPTTELDARIYPLRIIEGKVVQLILEGDHAHRIGVRLPKYGAKTRNLARSREG